MSANLNKTTSASPQMPTTAMNLREFPADLHSELKAKAAGAGKKLYQFVAEALREYLRQKESPAKPGPSAQAKGKRRGKAR